MTTLQNKKVSVVVPNYNYAKYIDKRIDSIMGQTYPIYELIILDDASTDGSVEKILRTLENRGVKLVECKTKDGMKEKIWEGAANGMKIQLIMNKKNIGKSMAAWKKGFELAKGDYVWIAEADDLCSKRFLEEVMRGFDDPEVVLSYTESMIINGWGLMMAPNFRWSRDKEKTGHYKKSYVKDGRQEIEEIMAIRCTIPNVSGVVFKKDAQVLKYLEESLKYMQVGDWYFYAKILKNGKIAYNHKSLNKFRIHRESVTRNSNEQRAERHLAEIKEMHEMFEKEYDLSEMTQKRMKAEYERVKMRTEE